MSSTDTEDRSRQIRKTPSLRFKKSQRLLNATAYSRVFDNANIRASHPNLLILARAGNSNLTHARLGIIISKKNVKLAVERNRLKRQIRESFRAKQHQLPAIDAIVLARRGADNLNTSELVKSLNGLWKRIIKRASQESGAG